MNDRIRELVDLATSDIKDEFGNWIGSEFDKELFVALIVTETCKMLVENSELRAATLVGKHFPLWK